jgi:beta-xylosidase
MIRYFSIFFLLSSSLALGQNPIVPPGIYIADPTARVWEDGKLYIYGSLDESTEYYCSWRHHVLETDNLINWKIHEDRFASKGENDQVPYSDALLFAPDCMYKNGTYYLYYCLSDINGTEGVATSADPTGPFTNGKKIELRGIEEIDPAVFIDDDGQGYYIWGQFKAKIAKLKTNMTEIDTSTIIRDLVTEKEHYFHEGGYMVKRNDIYYFIYADISRGNRPTCIGYSTSNSPLGPFKYGGVIVDNNYSDPSNWNNHGSIVEYKGQWYVFYHRATHNSRMMRKACVEPIYFNEDGSIDEVEMTSQGAGPPLNALEKIEAEQACLLFGNVRIQAYDTYKEELGAIDNQDNVAYKYINFKEGVNNFSVRAAGIKGGRISIRLDQPWREQIGYVDIPAGDGNTWQEYTGEIEDVEGVHALWLYFYGDGEDLLKLDWIRFSK